MDCTTEPVIFRRHTRWMPIAAGRAHVHGFLPRAATRLTLKTRELVRAAGRSGRSGRLPRPRHDGDRRGPHLRVVRSRDAQVEFAPKQAGEASWRNGSRVGRRRSESSQSCSRAGPVAATSTAKGASMSTPEGDRMSTPASDPRSTRGGGSVRGVGSAFFVGILLLIAGTLNLFYGSLQRCSHLGMDHHRPGRHPVHGGVLAVRRQRVWAGDRHHRGHPWRDRGTRQCRRTAPLVVTGCLCGLLVGHSRHLGARRAGKSLNGAGLSEVRASRVHASLPAVRAS